jgi:hypothetical protein
MLARKSMISEFRCFMVWHVSEFSTMKSNAGYSPPVVTKPYPLYPGTVVLASWGRSPWKLIPENKAGFIGIICDELEFLAEFV